MERLLQTLQETRRIHDSMNIPNIEYLLIFTFYYKYKTNQFFVLNYAIALTVCWNVQCQCEHGANGASKRLALHVQIRCGSLSITTSVSVLSNEFDIRSVLHGQVSLTAVNHIQYAFHGFMNGCKYLKIH